jgi:hypothetical protein
MIKKIVRGRATVVRDQLASAFACWAIYITRIGITQNRDSTMVPGRTYIYCTTIFIVVAIASQSGDAHNIIYFVVLSSPSLYRYTSCN